MSSISCDLLCLVQVRRETSLSTSSPRYRYPAGRYLDLADRNRCVRTARCGSRTVNAQGKDQAVAVSFNEATRRLLDGKNFATVATLNPDGGPHSAEGDPMDLEYGLPWPRCPRRVSGAVRRSGSRVAWARG